MCNTANTQHSGRQIAVIRHKFANISSRRQSEDKTIDHASHWQSKSMRLSQSNQNLNMKSNINNKITFCHHKK
jgi:hypothetical protein